MSTMSLIVTGTPSMALSGAPVRQRCSEARAAAKAPSRSRKQKALRRGCRASARPSSMSAASTGESAILRYSSTNAPAEANAMSLPLVMSPPRWLRCDYQPIARERQRRRDSAGDEEMQRLRLGRDADNRPGIRRPGVGLALPQFAVEADAAELPGDRQALPATHRYRDAVGAVGIVEPAREVLAPGVIVPDKADVEIAVGRVGLGGERQPRTDQRDRGDLQHRKTAGDRLVLDTDLQILRRRVDDDLANKLAGSRHAVLARNFVHRLLEGAEADALRQPPRTPGSAGADRVIGPVACLGPAGHEILDRPTNAERGGDVVGGAERQDRDRRTVGARLAHDPCDRAVTAGRDDDLGGMAQRLGEIALLGREITDAVTGAFGEVDKGLALVALIPRLLVVDQYRPSLLSRHTAINTTAGAAAPTSTKERQGWPSPRPKQPPVAGLVLAIHVLFAARMLRGRRGCPRQAQGTRLLRNCG